MVALCPGASGAAFAARELDTPLLAVCSAGPGAAPALRDALSLNSRLGADYFVTPTPATDSIFDMIEGGRNRVLVSATFGAETAF